MSKKTYERPKRIAPTEPHLIKLMLETYGDVAVIEFNWTDESGQKMSATIPYSLVERAYNLDPQALLSAYLAAG